MHATARVLPSAEDADAAHKGELGKFVDAQDIPELVEVYIPLSQLIAIKVVPSAEDAKEIQSSVVVIVGVHVVPELVER